jgi:catechol 2,3-dioxygenase-like lactoylglutathione lyase family enzyme
MRNAPLLRKVDAVTVRVPDLDTGLRFYRDALGHELLWRHDEIGQAGLAMPGSDTEIVLSTQLEYAPNWLVASAEEAARDIGAAGGRTIAGPLEIPVGRAAIVADPFGNVLVLVDLSKGSYETDQAGQVKGVIIAPPGDPGDQTPGR